MEYAIRAGVKVINLSLSAYSTKDASAIRDAMEDAKKAGIVVIGAAGNNGKDAKYYVPGNIPDAVIAGAASFNGKRIQESNYGSTVDYYMEADSTSQARLAALWAYYDLPYDGDITESYKFPVIWKNDEVSEIGEIYKNANGTYTIHADAPFKNGIVLESDYDKVDINVANGNNNGERITKGITIDKDHFAVIADESAMAMKEDDFANISLQVMVPLRSERDNGSLTADDNDTDNATYGSAGWSLNDSAK